MGIPVNSVTVGGVTKKSEYDTLYDNALLADTGGTPGGAQTIPGKKTFSDTCTVADFSGHSKFADGLSSSVIKLVTADYTILDDDHFTHFIVTATATTTVTLPTLAANQERPLNFINARSSLNSLIITGEGAENIERWNSVYIEKKFDRLEIYGGPSEWLRISGPIQPVSGETSGGTWYKYLNPTVSSIGIKTTGWTSDRFTTATGGMEVDFGVAGVKREGMKAVRATIQQAGTKGTVYYRPKGDTNISNTPNASNEFSHRILTGGDDLAVTTFWLSSDYKAEIAVTSTATDIYVAYPIEYLL